MLQGEICTRHIQDVWVYCSSKTNLKYRIEFNVSVKENRFGIYTNVGPDKMYHKKSMWFSFNPEKAAQYLSHAFYVTHFKYQFKWKQTKL